MQINRLFEIVYLLLDRKRTARELTEHFGVSRRTICRDIDTLSTAGIPIYTERGRGGGIHLMSHYVLDKSILSEQEQNEILSALQSLAGIKMDRTDQVLAKLTAVFGKTTTNWLEVDFAGWAYENNFWGDLKSSILEKRVVTFDYYNQQGQKTARRVEPIQLWFKSNAWYFKGFCLTKLGMRLFKLPRMKNLMVTDEDFIKRELHDAAVDPNESIYENQELSTVKLRIAPEKAYKVFDIFYEDMVEKQANGSFIATVRWPVDDWLRSLILSFGRYIEVLEPEHLRKSIQLEARSVADKYG